MTIEAARDEFGSLHQGSHKTERDIDDNTPSNSSTLRWQTASASARAPTIVGPNTKHAASGADRQLKEVIYFIH